MHPDMGDVFKKGEEAASKIRVAIAHLWDAKDRLPEAERAYREARWQAWLSAPSEAFAKEKEDYVDAQTAKLREERDRWEQVRKGSIEALRAHQQTLSYYQTKARVMEAEANLNRYGPEVSA